METVKRSKAINSVLLVLFFIPFILFAWTSPVNISNTEGRCKHPAMCQDKRGWLHVVYEDDTPGKDDIYYLVYNDTAWSDTLNVSDDATTSWRPDVTADTLNRIHVVWGDYDTGKIMWTMKDNFGWSNPTSISDSTPFSVAPEVDVSPVTNYVHCVWHNLGDDEIWHSYYDGSSWSVPENVTQDSNDDAWADVAIDSLGRIHLVWKDYGLNDIFYSRKDSISWQPFVNISNLTGQSCAPRIAIDNNNNPRVVWEEREIGYEAYYTYFDGSGWVSPVLVDINPSYTPDISIDKQNRSHIVWCHGNSVGNIFYTYYNDTSQCIPPEDASSTDSISQAPTLVIDSSSIHLVWNEAYGQSSSDNVEIYYSRKDISGIEDSESSIKVFSIPSIVIRELSLAYSLTEPSSVDVSIYDITGRKIKEKKLGYKNKGNYQFDLTLNLSSGMYFCILRTDNQKYRGKFIVLKP